MVETQAMPILDAASQIVYGLNYVQLNTQQRQYIVIYLRAHSIRF